MSGRTIILLVAGIIAAFTAVSVRNRLSSQQPVAEAPVASARVLIAKRDLTPGNFVQSAQDLDWSTNAVDESNGGPFLHEGSARIEDFNGAVVRRPLHAGDAVSTTALMKSGEGGFMSAVLDAGKRAVSIAVNATSGNAGFVSPGDKIDLIVTHRIKIHGENNNGNNGGGSTTEESVVSETFVRNVRVVAVDQMLDNPENKAILAKTVTVEVTPRQAEQIAVAAEMGKISVALRSLVNPENKVAKEGEGMPTLTDLYGNPMNAAGSPHDFTRDSDVSQLLDRKSVMMPRIHVIRGDQQENIEFYQGGR